MEERAIRRVVLLGFMASGKTTVGSLLAARLGWRHLDLDKAIEREEGRPIPRIFQEDGEVYFRRKEEELTRRHLTAVNTVLTPGGGWVTNPALFDLLPDDALSVWLRVSPEEVLRRLAATEVRRRPKLSGDDLESTVRRLLQERDPLYRRAELTLDTDHRSAAEIAQELESIVRGRMTAPSPS